MCFYSQQKDPIPKVQKRFNAKIEKPELFLQSNEINGFSFPNIPIITNLNPEIIETEYTWGLLPFWAKDEDFRKNTLNAKIETISEKPSFKEVLNNRCLIIATAFYEWHWLDAKGKQKQKYQINSDTELFAFAGLYSYWVNPENGNLLQTYTMLTTEANSTMQFVHNHKKRMPIILKQHDEMDWLTGKISTESLSFPYESNLVAFPI